MGTGGFFGAGEKKVGVSAFGAADLAEGRARRT